MPISSPKSIVSFQAGLRASGKSSTATIRADAHVDGEELVEVDRHGPSVPKRKLRYGVLSCPRVPTSRALSAPRVGVGQHQQLHAVARAGHGLRAAARGGRRARGLRLARKTSE